MSQRSRLGRRPRAGRNPAVGQSFVGVVLARHHEEWICLDVATWAFVRANAEADTTGAASTAPEDGAAAREMAEAPHATPGLFELATFDVRGPLEPPDPARPEALRTGPPRPLGAFATRRQVRRALAAVAVRDHPRARLLGSHGPSLAYVDVDGSAPSVEVIDVRKARLAAASRDGEPRLAFPFARSTQRLSPSSAELRAVLSVLPHGRDVRGALASALGYGPAFLLIGLGDVREGHVPKQVFAVLPAGLKRRTRRAAPLA